MSIEKDAAFLAGFITGTYDLKGEQQLPAYVRPFIDRVLAYEPGEKPSIKAKESAISHHVDDKYVVNIKPAEAKKLAAAIVKISEEETRYNGGDDDQFHDIKEMVRPKGDVVLRRRDIPPEMIDDIKKKQGSGMSLTAIGKLPEFNVTGQTIANWLKKNEKLQSSSPADA